MRDPGWPVAARRALVTALSLLLCLQGAPAGVLASDGPETAVLDLLEAVADERVDELDGLVCDAYRAAIQERFDVASGLPHGIDPAQLAGAIDVFITDRSVELISGTGERAEVRVSGRIGAIVDTAFLRDVMEASLGLFGSVDPGQLDELARQLAEQLRSGSTFSDDVSVVREGPAWLVCDDILVGAGAAAQDDTAEGLCLYMAVAELNAIDEQHGGARFESYSRRTWDEASGLCTYDAGEGSIGSVAVGRFDFPFQDIAAARPGGVEATVAGRRAYLADNDLFVALGEGLLYVQAPAKGMPDGEVDYLAMPAAVAELVLPRIDD